MQFLEQLFAVLRRAASCAPSAASRAATLPPASPPRSPSSRSSSCSDGKLGAGAESIFSEGAAEAARAVLSNATIADIVERENRDAGATMYYI